MPHLEYTFNSFLGVVERSRFIIIISIIIIIIIIIIFRSVERSSVIPGKKKGGFKRRGI